MPKVFRKERIEAEILRVMSDALANWKEPKIPKELISFTRVELTRDKRYAKIFVSIFNTEDDEAISRGIFEVLEKKVGYFRGFLGRQIRIYHIPELRLIYDEGIKESVRMQKIIDDLNIDKSAGTDLED